MQDAGIAEQPLAEYEYERVLINPKHETLLPESHWQRTIDGFVIGATPDALVDSACYPRLVQYKTLQNSSFDSTPRAEHVLQCVVELFVCGEQLNHLFYYKSTGALRCYAIESNDSKFVDIVWPWLRESFSMMTSIASECSTASSRMPNGEAKRREETILSSFVRRATTTSI